MLSAKNRLKTSAEIKRVFNNSSLLYSRNFKVFVYKRRGDNGTADPRFAFVISTKVSKKAVIRNKARRRVREIVRKYLKENKDKLQGKNIVFLFKNDLVMGRSTDITKKSLNAEVEKLLKNAQRL